MQFHLNGFQPGDPSPRPGAPPPSPQAEVDVLIVGAGPAGLTLAAQLAQFPEISTRIVEQKPGPLQLGQADGIACRTMEMFQAFGFADRVLKEGYFVNEVSFWKPDPAQRGRIVRSARVQDVEDGLSEFPHVILSQARIHDFYLEAMRRAPAPLQPDYATRLVSLARADGGNRPVTATLVRDGVEATVDARYVVGCDGARSGVRAAIGGALHGEAANQAWGVMDVLAVTDFPDVRLKSAIQSASEGSALIIPREGGYLFRIYIELDKLNPDERVSGLNLTAEALVAAAQRIFTPFTFEVKEIVWWSAYEIGQRICDRFDDSGAGRAPRVFVAGDACHTHSPKAGQGMNVSMQDAFNLGWKLAAVLRGQSQPALLETYASERRRVAQDLIDFDREWAAMFSAPPLDPSQPQSAGVDPAAFQRYFVKQLRYTAGVETQYHRSPICGVAAHQALAPGFPIGRRFHSAPVVRLADALRVHLGHCAEADGRWRLYAFADADSSALRALCEFLAASERSPIRRATPPGGDFDAVIDLRAILQQGHREIALETIPAALTPRKGRYGLTDYEKMFCPDPADDVFAARGVDRRGALIVVRPDQYVAGVLPLDAHDEIAAFFAGFLRPSE